jgi:hypothetical protein
MTHHDDDVPNAELVSHEFDVALKERGAVNLEQRLRKDPGVRIGANALARGGNEADNL